VDASDASSPEDAGCESSSRVCGCVVHDFCDDFDVDGEALAARWSGVLGAANPFTKGDASFAYTTQALSPPRAVQTNTYDPKDVSLALIAHQLDFDKAYPGREFLGFRFTLDVQLETLVVTERGGPVVDAGSAVAAAVASYTGLDATGVAIVFAPMGAYLFAGRGLFRGQGLLPDAGDGSIVPIYDGDLLGYAKSWLHAEIVVADKARAVREGFASCSALDDGPVVAATVGPARVSQACTPLPPGVGFAWARQPGVTAGAALMAAGTLAIRQDNVAFDFLAP